MRIAVLGTGKIGGGLGERFREAGHDVVLGSRDVAAGVPYAEAVQGAEVTVLALPWRVAEETVATLGGLAGQVVVDTMNPYANHPGQLALPELYGTSGLERLQALLPEARLVKCWNHVYAHTIRTSPDFGGLAATALICGDDQAARSTVAELARQIGFDPVDVGDATGARYLEPLAGLMIRRAIPLGGGFELAFRLLRQTA